MRAACKSTSRGNFYKSRVEFRRKIGAWVKFKTKVLGSVDKIL